MKEMKIAGIDDDPSIRNIYDITFNRKHWEHYILDNPEKLIDVPEDIGIIVSDCEMGQWNQRDTMRIAAQYLPSAPLLFVSGNYDITFELSKEGFYTMEKPFKMSELCDAIEIIYAASQTGAYTL